MEFVMSRGDALRKESGRTEEICFHKLLSLPLKKVSASVPMNLKHENEFEVGLGLVQFGGK